MRRLDGSLRYDAAGNLQPADHRHARQQLFANLREAERRALGPDYQLDGPLLQAEGAVPANAPAAQPAPFRAPDMPWKWHDNPALPKVSRNAPRERWSALTRPPNRVDRGLRFTASRSPCPPS